MVKRAGKSTQGSLRREHLAWLERISTEWMDAVTAPLLLLTPEAQILHGNQIVQNLTGYSCEELHRKHLWDLTTIAEKPRVQAGLKSLTSSQAAPVLQILWIAKTGEEFHLQWRFKPLPGAQGADLVWIATGNPLSTPFQLLAADHSPNTSREELTALIESSTDFIALADMEGQLIFINHAGQELVGLANLQAVQQTTIADYFFDNGVERLKNEVLPTVFDTGSWQGELEMRHFQTGAAVPVLFNSTLVRHPQTGEPMGLGTVGRNITDIKKMEREHLNAEASLHSLMVGTAAATGEEFFPIFVEQVARSLGVSHALVSEKVDNQLETLAFWSSNQLQPNYRYSYLNTPCELSLQQGVYACAVGVQQSFPHDRDLVRLGAESYLGLAIQNRLGETIGNLCLLDTKPLANVERMETTLRIFASRAAAELERQRATNALEKLNQTVGKALQESQTLLKLVLDNLPLAIFWKDRHGRYLGCNQLLLRDAGLNSVADIVGKTDFDLPWQEEAPRYRADDFAVMASGQPKLDIEEPITKAGNVYRWLRTTKMPLYNPAGEIIGMLGTYEDITERKQMEAQLRQSHENLALANLELSRATRLKDEFLANISHELRTPLSSILGMTQALSREIYGPLTERQHRSLNIVERSGRHLLHLINNILDVAKVEAGKVELDITQVSLARLCQDSLVFVQQQAFQKHINLKSSLAPDMTTVNGDELRLKQALINLLDNAIKFTPEGGAVELHVAPAPKSPYLAKSAQQVVSISVIDTGIGIAPSDQERLFQTFVQLDNSLNRQYFGTGLGLAMVKRITEMHGGIVEVDSQPKKGSRFTLHLPVK